MSTKEVAAELAKASPPVSVAGLHFCGVSLADWTLILTMLYTLCMLFFLFRDKWWRDRNGRKD